MSVPKPRSSKKRFFKLVAIVTTVALACVLGLHIWFVNNARGVLKRMVASESKGKLKLELSQLRFDFFSNKLQIREADLISIDTTHDASTYHIKFRKLTLHVNSFWALIFQRKILLDSIKLHDPLIEVTQWRADTATKNKSQELSLSQQLGKLHNSILDGLEAMGVRRIIINNATVRLINKIKRGSEPITISNIYLDLVRNPKTEEAKDAGLDESVDLITTNQDIALPSGKHRLAFRSFKLRLFQKRIELDSCTVTKISTDSSKSNYKIFFKRLSLVGVDFDAMYTHNLIRADSVYCENPLFDIHLNLSASQPSKKKEKPDLQKIVRDLTGDLELAFVGVKETGIHIDISGTKTRSLFNSNKDNFEMRGLRINADSSTPVVVQQFDMLVRDYKLYNEDSSAAYGFDSIHFLNNKIVLNNFTVFTTPGARTVRSERDFRIPLFQLTGLDWYELIFEQNLKAKEAFLYNPVINYTRHIIHNRKKKANVFASIQSLDSLLTLEKIDVVNGQLNMKLGTTAINLQDVDLSLFSDRLLKSGDNAGLRRAVERLSFANGKFVVKDITAQLVNAKYTGNNLIHAEKLLIASKSNRIKASVNDIVINDMLFDDDMESIVVNGLQWQSAKISLNAPPGSNSGRSASNMQLRNISGNNTQIVFSNPKSQVSSFVKTLKISELTKKGSAPIHIEGLAVTGSDLNVNSADAKIKASSYGLVSSGTSYVRGLDFQQVRGNDSVHIKSQSVNFSADINALAAKDFHIESLDVESPVISMVKSNSPTAAANVKQNELSIGRVRVNHPSVDIVMNKSDSTSRFNIPAESNAVIEGSGLKINGSDINFDRLSIKADAATFTKNTGEVLGVEKGKVDLEVSGVSVSKKEGKPQWKATINHLQLENPNRFALGKNKNKLQLETVSLGNLSLSSEYMSDMKLFMKFNLTAWLKGTTGQYIDSNTTLKWYNANYNATSRDFHVDSFLYRPTPERDSLIARTPYQMDYITVHTNAIDLKDFDLASYQKDSAFIAAEMTIEKPVLTVYRDKFPPFQTGVVKPLPVDAIRRIASPLSLQRININDGMLSYSEKNAKTRKEGTLYLTHINGGLREIKNIGISPTDSLQLALDAYLMDSAAIKLRVKESYTDSLGGFLMTLRMNPTTLAFLNPVLAPLSNVIITSGRIDSLQLRAIGRDDLSYGEMKMYYHGLKIKLVKNGQENSSSFAGRFASFLANTFIIKKNNSGRTGLVYFPRLRDRSFFNYIVKMTFSGMATSIGVKRNKKYQKQYERELREKSLPPISFE